jgi:riboflavin kinase/FMN adenylyltransferase
LRNLARKPVRPVVTLGNFDGIHAGHQRIFSETLRMARERGGVCVVYTFDPHPLKVLAPEQNLTLLNTFKKKMELIAVYGMDITILADFTRAFARMHPRDFALKLKQGLGMDTIVVGHDYSFGQSRSGTIAYLKKMGAELGFTVEVVEPVTVDGERVSSTMIRALINNGEVREAARRLNRLYSIEGKVVSGYKRGAAIGFPTANLDTPYEVIPAVGVYAVFARLGAGEWREGVVNIGYNPTFNRNDMIVEAHLIDHNEDLYGAEIEIYFADKLRDEKRFGSVDQLKSQISLDIELSRKILADYRKSGDVIDPRGAV